MNFVSRTWTSARRIRVVTMANVETVETAINVSVAVRAITDSAVNARSTSAAQTRAALVSARTSSTRLNVTVTTRVL